MVRSHVNVICILARYQLGSHSACFEIHYLQTPSCAWKELDGYICAQTTALLFLLRSNLLEALTSQNISFFHL